MCDRGANIDVERHICINNAISYVTILLTMQTFEINPKSKEIGNFYLLAFNASLIRTAMFV